MACQSGLWAMNGTGKDSFRVANIKKRLGLLQSQVLWFSGMDV
jgi:hypothetical protein